jgi:hypothetical protein
VRETMGINVSSITTYTAEIDYKKNYIVNDLNELEGNLVDDIVNMILEGIEEEKEPSTDEEIENNLRSRKRRTRITREIIVKVWELFNRGESNESIMLETNISLSSLNRILNKESGYEL